MDETTANCPKSILVFDEADLNSLNEDLISVLAATSYITQEIREFVKLAEAAKPITDQGAALDHITKTQRQIFQRCLILRAVSFLETYEATGTAAQNDATGILNELRRSNASRIKALGKSGMKKIAEKVRHQAFAHIDLEGIKNSYREWSEEKSTQFILDPDGLNSWDTFGETVVYVLGMRQSISTKSGKGGARTAQEIEEIQQGLWPWIQDVCGFAVEFHEKLLMKINSHLGGPSELRLSEFRIPKDRYTTLEEFRLPLYCGRSEN